MFFDLGVEGAPVADLLQVRLVFANEQHCLHLQGRQILISRLQLPLQLSNSLLVVLAVVVAPRGDELFDCLRLLLCDCLAGLQFVVHQIEYLFVVFELSLESQRALPQFGVFSLEGHDLIVALHLVDAIADQLLLLVRPAHQSLVQSRLVSLQELIHLLRDVPRRLLHPLQRSQLGKRPL